MKRRRSVGGRGRELVVDVLADADVVVAGGSRLERASDIHAIPVGRVLGEYFSIPVVDAHQKVCLRPGGVDSKPVILRSNHLEQTFVDYFVVGSMLYRIALVASIEFDR